MKLTALLPTKPIPPIIDAAKQKILLIAPPKFGKSTWCASFPDPLFLCTEEGHDALNVRRISLDCWDYIEDEKPTSMEKLVRVDKRGVHHMSFITALTLLRKSQDFGTLVIDTIDRLHGMATDYICRKKGIEHPSDEEYGKAWHAIRDDFNKACFQLTRLNRGVIFISHVKYRDVENTKIGSKITQAQATMTDACRAIIEPEVNIIMHGGWDKGKDGLKERVWKCEPDDSVRECGDRTGKLPPKFPCLKTGGYAKFASYFDKRK